MPVIASTKPVAVTQRGPKRGSNWLAFPALTMHPHGGLATIGAAVSVARLRGLDGPGMLAAVNAAAALVVPGPFNHAVEGALMRNVWPGVCAQNGLRAVDWVDMGIHGGANALHEVFAVIFAAHPSPEQLTAGLGHDFTLRDGYHKMHACCQYSHSTVEATLAALGPRRIDPAEVAAITVATHPKGMLLDNAQPATTLAAKFSIQHIAAATLAKIVSHRELGVEPQVSSMLTREAFAQIQATARRIFLPEIVADYIAGMTDRFAAREHERLTGRRLLA